MAATGDRGRTEEEASGYTTGGTIDGNTPGESTPNESTPGGYVSQTVGKVADAILGKDTTVTQKVNILTVAVLAGLAYIIFRKK